MLFSLLIFCMLSTLAYSAPQIKSEFPFPLLDNNGVSHESATPFYTFDGIDYNELPPKFKNDYYSCYGDHVRCIRNRNYFHDVCAYLSWAGEYGSYYSMCQLDHLNCLSRIYNYQGLYGTFYSNDKTFFQGEGYNCQKSQNAKETRKK